MSCPYVSSGRAGACPRHKNNRISNGGGKPPPYGEDDTNMGDREKQFCGTPGAAFPTRGIERLCHSEEHSDEESSHPMFA